MLRSVAYRSSSFVRASLVANVGRRSFIAPSASVFAERPDHVESELTHPALLKDPPISNPSSETDPWSLVPPPPPSHPEGLELLSMEELISSPHPEGRDAEKTETLRKRLVYESRKRGILETDLILATFAKDRLGTMVDRELREYDRVSQFLFSFLLDATNINPSIPSCTDCDR